MYKKKNNTKILMFGEHTLLIEKHRQIIIFLVMFVSKQIEPE
jgi:hypothetical protein